MTLRTKLILFLILYPLCGMADDFSGCVQYFNEPSNFKEDARFYGLRDRSAAIDQSRVIAYCECMIEVKRNNLPMDGQAKLMCGMKSRMFETMDF